jgi:hypothetical protein
MHPAAWLLKARVAKVGRRTLEFARRPFQSVICFRVFIPQTDLLVSGQDLLFSFGPIAQPREEEDSVSTAGSSGCLAAAIRYDPSHLTLRITVTASAAHTPWMARPEVRVARL